MTFPSSSNTHREPDLVKYTREVWRQRESRAQKVAKKTEREEEKWFKDIYYIQEYTVIKKYTVTIHVLKRKFLTQWDLLLCIVNS